MTLDAISGRRAALISVGVTMCLLSAGGACAPVAARIVIGIATEVVIEVGKELVHELFDSNQDDRHPSVTIRHTDGNGVRASVTYEVDQAHAILVNSLEGSVRISGTGCGRTVSVDPGSTARIEIFEDDSAQVDCRAEGPVVIGSVALEELQVGDCVEDLQEDVEVSSLLVVRCDTPHQGELFAVFNLSGANFPGKERAEKLSEDGCDSRLANYSPSANDDSNIGLFYFAPTDGTWKNGDKSVLCIAKGKGSKLVGSIRGR